MPSAPLDTHYQIETPEGIDLPLRPAGLMPRALAFAFDLGLRGLIMGILLVPLALLGNIGFGLGSLLLFLSRPSERPTEREERLGVAGALLRSSQLFPSCRAPMRQHSRSLGAPQHY